MVKRGNTASPWSHGNIKWNNGLTASRIHWRTVARVASSKMNLGRSGKQRNGDTHEADN
jgi:hypothetical protein